MVEKVVLHICLSSGWGGLEMYPIRIGAEQRLNGWKVLGICIKGSPVAKGMRKQGFEVLEFSSKKYALLSIFSINRWLNSQKATHIHCHKSGDLLLAALLDAVAPRRVFFTEHMGGKSSKRDIYHRWIYQHVERVFSISDFTRALNVKNLPIAAEQVTRLWLGTKENAPILEHSEIGKIRMELGIPVDAKVIGMLGRIDTGKGQAQLLDAFQLLVQQGNDDACLLIVGGLTAQQGSDESFVVDLKQKVSKYGLGEKVFFSGFRTDTPQMLAAMDIVCLLSKEEAFGLTVIEAMMAQKTVVGANSGAIPEILVDDELLVVYDDSQAISDKLINLLENGRLPEISHSMRQRALKHFSLNGHVANLEKWLNK